MVFDHIDPRLPPTDRSTQLAVYRLSGDMSAIAVESLTRLGYTDIVELDGGMTPGSKAAGGSTADLRARESPLPRSSAMARDR